MRPIARLRVLPRRHWSGVCLVGRGDPAYSLRFQNAAFGVAYPRYGWGIASRGCFDSWGLQRVVSYGHYGATWYSPGFVNQTFVPTCDLPIQQVPAAPPVYQATIVPRVGVGHAVAQHPQIPIAQGHESRLANSFNASSVDFGESTAEGVPKRLLDVADALCRVGGRTEAAVAYARLELRYPGSHALQARRFVARLLSGDLEQARLIADAAEMSGTKFDLSCLPEGGLAGLGVDAELHQTVTEKLAEYSLGSPADVAGYSALVHWFRLSGDTERSNLFESKIALLVNQPQVSKPARLVKKEN